MMAAVPPLSPENTAMLNRRFMCRRDNLLGLAALIVLAGVYSFASAAEPADKLPADGIYPQGRKLAFMGYSGDPARDLANGFTVAGPVYGNQTAYLERCFQNDWPVVAHIGPRITFKDKDPAKYKLDPVTLKEEVEKQVRELAVHKQIVWWAVHPEELRHWRKDEMQYLTIVCETIRKNDPRGPAHISLQPPTTAMPRASCPLHGKLMSSPRDVT